MDRRDFLRVGASGLLISGVSSCASLPKLRLGPSPDTPMPDMDAYLKQVDSGMETIAAWSPSRNAQWYGDDGAALDELARKSLRTLYMTGMLGDLPPKAQIHPGMQERVWAVMPEMDEAVAGMERYLATRSEEEMARVQLALRSPSNHGMTIAQAIDEHAALCGVSQSRRMQTRVLLTDAVWRLRNQPPALTVQDTLRRVQRAGAVDPSRTAMEDLVAARVGEKLFWQQQDTDSGGGGSSDQTQSLRRKRIAKGGRVMGIGLVVGGLAVALTAAGAVPFIFVATVGAIMFLVGLIMLFVGLATPPDKTAG